MFDAVVVKFVFLLFVPALSIYVVVLNVAVPPTDPEKAVFPPHDRFVPVAVNGPAVALRQYETGLVTVGGAGCAQEVALDPFKDVVLKAPTETEYTLQ